MALGRQLMADAAWGVKAAEGRDADILKCISCGECSAELMSGVPVRCLINPQLGREGWLTEPEPAATVKKVMVVGGGPAGMEAARVAALRGHRVTIHEEKQVLGGGQLTLAKAPPYKEKLGWLDDYLIGQLEALPVEVRLGSRVTAADVEREAPDAVVVATGAVPLVPDIPGIAGDNVATAFSVLAGETVAEGKRIVVLGGRRVGTETSEFLAARGNNVTIVTRSPLSQLADDAPGRYRAPLLKRLKDAGVAFLGGHEVKEIVGDGIHLVGNDGMERTLPADLVVIARGAVSDRELADEVGDLVPEVHVVGDSVEPRTIAEAMYEGTLVGRRI